MYGLVGPIVVAYVPSVVPRSLGFPDAVRSAAHGASPLHWSQRSLAVPPVRTGASVGSPAPAFAKPCNTPGARSNKAVWTPKTTVLIPAAYAVCSRKITESGAHSEFESSQ